TKSQLHLIMRVLLGSRPKAFYFPHTSTMHACGLPVIGKVSSMRTGKTGKPIAKNSYRSVHLPVVIGKSGAEGTSSAECKYTLAGLETGPRLEAEGEVCAVPV